MIFSIYRPFYAITPTGNWTIDPNRFAFTMGDIIEPTITAEEIGQLLGGN